MINVNLHQPGKIDCILSFPSEWNELHKDEVLEISKRQLITSEHVQWQKAEILSFILFYRAKLAKISQHWLRLIDTEQAVIDGFPLLDFIYGKNTLTQTPEKLIKLPGLIPITMYGPGDGFETITCGEFEDAEQFFFEFLAKPGQEPLAKLASTLYRPKNVPYITLNAKTGSYISYKSDVQLSKFMKLKPWRLYAIFIWYTGCRARLPKIFPTVHETYGDEKATNDTLGFTKCIHAGAGEKNGTRNEIRMTSLLEFMFDMEQEAIKAKELKKMYDQAG